MCFSTSQRSFLSRNNDLKLFLIFLKFYKIFFILKFVNKFKYKINNRLILFAREIFCCIKGKNASVLY